MLRLLALALALLALGGAACGDEEETAGGGEPEATATATPSEAEQAGCRRVEAPAPRPEQDRRKPRLRLDPSVTYVAEVSTSCGDFEITLDAERAPKTGGSFVALARDGFFDGLIFHRVEAGFVIQGGDPQGEGTGGPGYSVTEAPPEDLVYRNGVVAMAKTPVEDPGTSGSQFFIVTAQDAALAPDYALLGRVTKGGEVVRRIDAVPVDEENRPIEPVVIERITIRES